MSSLAQDGTGTSGNAGASAVPLLQVRALRGGYGRVEVLRGVDLEVRPGEIVALLGSNGAGKSTLNNTVCGLVPAWGGQVVFDGADLTGAHYRAIVKAGLIQVPEGRRVFPNLTVRENLVMAARPTPGSDRGWTYERVMQTFPRLAERVGGRGGAVRGVGRGERPSASDSDSDSDSVSMKRFAAAAGLG